MSVAKIIEITSESNKSFEDAIVKGIERANKTVHGVRGAWIKEQQVLVEDGAIKGYRVDMKVTFILNE
ncbi:MAG: dodecin family protein [Planctomycetaceae bacterium]|nr:dodecin family protein [Planctomycetaceae bacterium]